MTDKTLQTYVIRCTDCGNTKRVSHDDGRTAYQTKGTEHTPKSKAARLQRRAADSCGNCGCKRFGVSPQ